MLEVITADRPSVYVNLGPHPPRLWPEDLDRARALAAAPGGLRCPPAPSRRDWHCTAAAPEGPGKRPPPGSAQRPRERTAEELKPLRQNRIPRHLNDQGEFCRMGASSQAVVTPERIQQLAWGYAPPLVVEAARHS